MGLRYAGGRIPSWAGGAAVGVPRVGAGWAARGCGALRLSGGAGLAEDHAGAARWLRRPGLERHVLLLFAAGPSVRQIVLPESRRQVGVRLRCGVGGELLGADLGGLGGTLVPLADLVGVSPRTLRRRVPAAVGMGPKDLHRVNSDDAGARVVLAVRSDDLDVNGHLRGPAYLAYADHARWVAMDAAGIDVTGLQLAGSARSTRRPPRGITGSCAHWTGWRSSRRSSGAAARPPGWRSGCRGRTEPWSPR